MIASIVTGALSGVLIEKFPKTIFYLIMASIAFVSTLMFSCIQEPIDVKGDTKVAESSEVELHRIEPVNEDEKPNEE